MGNLSLLEHLDHFFSSGLRYSHLYIGFSGGLDSTVLLHLLINSRIKIPVTAVHIHHGLQAAANHWQAHCAEFCQQYAIDYQSLTVQVNIKAGDSLEASARAARYAAFCDLMQTSRQPAALLTAHHADDQLETFMLNVLRGSGLRGLAAMPDRRVLIDGAIQHWHCRPLLPYRRQQLQDYAELNQLQWLNDPSNQDQRFDRNYLRQQVLPLLSKRWPQMATTLGRSVVHLQNSLLLEEQLAMLDLGQTACNPLAIKPLQGLSSIRRYNALRYWLRQQQVLMPSQAVLEQIDQALLADNDAMPEVRWATYCVRCYRAYLYCMPAMVEQLTSLQLDWRLSQPLVISVLGLTIHADSLGELTACLPDDAVLTVRFRQGGERIQLPGRKHRHQVKKLLQAQCVPPWLRDSLPFVYYRSDLIAVLGIKPPLLAATTVLTQKAKSS